LAIILFIAEIKVASYGMLSLGGLIALTLGSLMLFQGVAVSLRLMAPTIALVGGFFVVVSSLAFRAYRAKPQSGVDGMVGLKGLVRQTIDPEGLVFIHGEIWRAVSEKKLEPGDKVQVQSVDGLTLKVKKVEE
jgi:membrane-bound serine protease (ClpP class)